jgi:hypothetical protein
MTYRRCWRWTNPDQLVAGRGGRERQKENVWQGGAQGRPLEASALRAPGARKAAGRGGQGGMEHGRFGSGQARYLVLSGAKLNGENTLDTWKHL